MIFTNLKVSKKIIDFTRDSSNSISKIIISAIRMLVDLLLKNEKKENVYISLTKCQAL